MNQHESNHNDVYPVSENNHGTRFENNCTIDAQKNEINDQTLLSTNKSFVSAIQRDSGPTIENDITNDQKFTRSPGEKKYETIPTADKHKKFTQFQDAKKHVKTTHDSKPTLENDFVNDQKLTNEKEIERNEKQI